jgi:multidrug resistance efflux pump
MDRLNAKIDTMRKESASLSDDSIDNLMVPLNEQHRDLEGKIKTTTMQLAHLQTRLQSRKESADFLEHELMSTKVRLAQNVIRAPFSGIIADRVEEPGWLSPEDMICEVWDDSAYRVEVELLQHQLSFVHPGQTVLVALDFGHNQSVRGTVESVDAGNLTPPVSGPPTFKAIVKLDGKVSWLQPGMQVSVRVHTGGAK